MPASMIPSFAKQSGKSEKEVEKLWHDAKKYAEEEGHKEDYPYITGILKRMLKLESTHVSFKEFFNESRLDDEVSKEVSQILKGKVDKDAVYFYNDKLFMDKSAKTFEVETKRIGMVKVHYKESKPANGNKVYSYDFEYLD